ncbi:type I-C CRISPR-associated protein Cas8c/Csd1 [Maritimibacter sp.]|uniref:type I-C CRISPR-associated protein Cas8c/Csd1 n=1 Tax=Maritimibacter sp. TaxID=2003363 RepID=UPI0025797C6C|nr:type I-C CRISPR-associated protein Cas8c/Csd1 [Maritimibacter sp.]
MLSSLARLYQRLRAAGDVPPFGYTRERISWSLRIDEHGMPVQLIDRRRVIEDGKVPVLEDVPAGERTADIKPKLFWDRGTYVFGSAGTSAVKNGEDQNNSTKLRSRTEAEHQAFVDFHRNVLKGASDPALIAFRRFVDSWSPEMFARMGFDESALTSNIVFEVDFGEGPQFIHDRPEARAIVESRSSGPLGTCFVTGETTPIERLHPRIKGVLGTKGFGASLVSFAEPVSESFGFRQSENAPISSSAAFTSAAALNSLLSRESQNRLLLGPCSVVFWADTDCPMEADVIEPMVRKGLKGSKEYTSSQAVDDDVAQMWERMGSLTTQCRDVVVCILVLSANAGRLSVQYWYKAKISEFLVALESLRADLALDQAHWLKGPAARPLLFASAARTNGRVRSDAIGPALVTALLQGVLNRRAVPRSFVARTLASIRVDGEISDQRAAVCKAYVNRESSSHPLPKKLSDEIEDVSYNLGRLFAVLESVQLVNNSRLGNSFVGQGFARAAGSPAATFPRLITVARAKLDTFDDARDKARFSWVETELKNVMERLPSDLPAHLALEDQARFVVGYFQQRWTKRDRIEGAASIEA